MSDFQKPLKRPSTSRPLREFPVVGAPENDEQTTHYGNHNDFDDHFEISAEEEEALRQARKEKLNPPINPQSKTRLEYLADIGKMTKDVVIGGTAFTLRTLKSKEQRQVYMTLVDVNNKVDEAYNIKFHTLAYSLTKIDHQDVSIMVKVNSHSDKIKMLEEMEETLTTKLYDAYLELKTTSDAQFAIKDDKDMKEVSEDLKKS